MYLSTRTPRLCAAACVIVVAVCLMAGLPLGTWACQCTYLPTLAEQVASADVVFAGTVTGTWDPESNCPPNDLETTFTPTIRWKGPLDSTVQVHQDCSCAWSHFEVGQAFIVFAWNTTRDGQPVLWTHVCALNTWYDPGIVAQMPPPESPVPARVPTWGRVKTLYR
jgi:hypothetical protein